MIAKEDLVKNDSYRIEVFPGNYKIGAWQGRWFYVTGHGSYDYDEALEIEKIEVIESGEQVNHPAHYNNHPSGIECIEVVQHMNFCLGNAVKYIWRAGLKSDDKKQDLEKARFYINQELKRLENA